MFRKLILPASLGLSALIALVPSAASAQSYGRWAGQDDAASSYQDGHYDQRRSYGDRGSYRERQRWIAHRRWEQEQRRREWRREHWRGGDDRGYGRDYHDYGRDYHDDRNGY